MIQGELKANQAKDAGWAARFESVHKNYRPTSLPIFKVKVLRPYLSGTVAIFQANPLPYNYFTTRRKQQIDTLATLSFGRILKNYLTDQSV